MIQPLDINKLAQETAQNIFWEVPLMERSTSALQPFILVALTKLAAEKDAEIARHKAALKVAMDALANAQQLAATEDHWAFAEIRQGTEDALTQIEKEIKP